jgi:chromosome partitioning protein
MRVISIYNKKGGTGKTSLATSLASALAMLGYHVGLIDGDEQANASALIRPNHYSKPTLTQVVCDDIPLARAMYQARTNLWVVPADMYLSRAVERINANAEFHLLSEHIDTLRSTLADSSTNHYLPWWDKPEVRVRDFRIERPAPEDFRTPPSYLDFLFLDNPPNPNALTWAMLYACNELLIPVELEEYAFQGLAQMFEDVSRRFKKQQQQIKIAGIVPFNVMHQRSMTIDYLASVWRAFPSLVLRSIHTDATIPTSQGNQETIYETNRSSRAAKEIFALALQLVGYSGQPIGMDSCAHCLAAQERAQIAPEGVQ